MSVKEFIPLEQEYNKLYYYHIADIYGFDYNHDHRDKASIDQISEKSYIQYPLQISNYLMNRLFEEKLLLFDNDHTYHTYKYDHDDTISLNKFHKINNIIEKFDEIQKYHKESIHGDKFYSLLTKDPIQTEPTPQMDTTTDGYQPFKGLDKSAHTSTETGPKIADANAKKLMIIDMVTRYMGGGVDEAIKMLDAQDTQDVAARNAGNRANAKIARKGAINSKSRVRAAESAANANNPALQKQAQERAAAVAAAAETTRNRAAATPGMRGGSI